jgi:nucleoside-diphosphate-sugar epimerase
MKDQRVLITGVAGRVGAAIALELARDNEVHGMDCTDGVARKNLEAAGVIYHKTRMGIDPLDGLPEHFDYVFHQAVSWQVDSPEQEREAYCVSVKGVAELLKKYRDAKRFVLGSTGGVCAPSELPVEESALRNPDSDPYHSYKFAMEIVGELAADTEGISVVIPRYYWPWSEHNGFPQTWVIAPLLKGHAVSICGGKPDRFSPVFMPDCVRYTIGLAELPEVPRIVNVSGSEVVSVNDMARLVGEIMGHPPVFCNHRVAMPTFLGDPTLLHSLLGPPEYDMRRSLEAAVNWLKRHNELVKARDVFDAPGNW